MQSKRPYEFVEYHIHGDGECNGMTLKAYADKHELSKEDRLDLCFLFSITYCVESAIVLLKKREEYAGNIDEWVKGNKDKLVFQSDRKYIRMLNAFNTCLSFFEDKHEKILRVASGRELDLRRLIPEVERWPYFGRFSAYLFLETVAWVLDYSIINAEMEWENGDTATSGLLNVYGYDKAADAFDASGKLEKPFNQQVMQRMVEPLLLAIERCGGNNNITMVETSLCAYRKFFKGTRYNGYYLDRMLEEIYQMSAAFPEISKELIEIRTGLFDSKYLGEAGGWKGIRKECKKLYKEQGIIM